MADSIRLTVLKELTTYLEGEITVANGYPYTMTGAIFRGRHRFGDDDPLPCASLLEAPTNDQAPIAVGEANLLRFELWTLLVQGWVTDDPLNPTDPAHQLLASFKQAFGRLRKRVHNCELAGTPFENISGIEMDGGICRPPDEISEKAYFWMRVVLKLLEKVDEPFSS